MERDVDELKMAVVAGGYFVGVAGDGVGEPDDGAGNGAAGGVNDVANERGGGLRERRRPGLLRLPAERRLG